MDKQLLKRRVIGATVLVGLGVIFIPMILSGGRDEMPLFGSNIPDKPRAIEKLKSMDIPRPSKVEKPAEIRLPVDERIPTSNIEKDNIPSKTEKETNKRAKVVADQTKKKSITPKAWVVQLGSFGNRSNALALQKKLRKHKFAAFVEFVKNNKGGVYRVRVGPEVKRDKAENILQAIEKKLGIKGVVVSHP